jgi:hypothetical protein
VLVDNGDHSSSSQIKMMEILSLSRHNMLSTINECKIVNSLYIFDLPHGHPINTGIHRLGILDKVSYP